MDKTRTAKEEVDGLKRWVFARIVEFCQQPDGVQELAKASKVHPAVISSILAKKTSVGRTWPEFLDAMGITLDEALARSRVNE